MQDLVGEAKEADASLVLRRRKTFDPPTASDPQSPLVEEESPSAVVAGILDEPTLLL